MKRDFLDFVGKPSRLVVSLKRLSLGGALAGLGLLSAVSTPEASRSTTPPPAPIITPTVVDRSRKTAKLVLQLPTQTGHEMAQHRSHSSHRSHRSHSSHVSGTGGTVRTPPAVVPPPSTPKSAAPAAAAGLLAVTPSSAEQTTGKFASFNATSRVLTVKDAVGASIEFAMRDDTILLFMNQSRRLDEYVESLGRVLPFTVNQQVRVAWKPSTDGTKRVAVSIQ